MFHLQAGVHLHEVERVRVPVRDQELHGPRAHVVHGTGGLHSGLADPLPRGGVQQGGRRFLDHLLVTALQRAFALPQVDHVTVGVREDLHLDVARGGHELLDQQGVVPEALHGHAACGGQGLREVLGAFDHVHALTAATGGGLDEHGEGHVRGGRDQLLVAEPGFGDAPDQRHAVVGDLLLGGDLVAHDLQRAFPRADEGDPRLAAGPGERDVLGEEPVARVDRLGAGLARGGQDGVDVQIALGRGGGTDPHGHVRFPDVARTGVGVRVHGHGTDAQGTQGAHHAHGDLATIGDEHGGEHDGDSYIRKRPKPGSGRGCRDAAASASARTRRVSRGSITPSSHSRAVE